MVQQQPPPDEAGPQQDGTQGQPGQQDRNQFSQIDPGAAQAKGDLMLQGIGRAVIHQHHQQGCHQDARHQDHRACRHEIAVLSPAQEDGIDHHEQKENAPGQKERGALRELPQLRLDIVEHMEAPFPPQRISFFWNRPIPTPVAAPNQTSPVIQHRAR